MKTKEIALINLVKELVKDFGFEGYKALSNWVRDIIKSKENFEERFIVQQDDTYNRPEKIIVTEEARTLIDNLCILKPYMRLFEKVIYDTDHFSPYRQLKSSNKSGLKTRCEKLKTDLEAKKKAIEEALIQLPKITAVLCSNNPIDITTDSLRELIEKSCPSNEAVNFSKSFQIAAWNELSTLETQLKEKGESSETYRKIAEKLLELGDLESALEALDDAIAISSDDGIAWALKAKIYLDLLRNARKEQMTALSLSDFSGGFEHPLNSEERWINERIEDAYSSTEKLHALFIEACFFALEHCPCWDNSTRTDKNGTQRKNFKSEYTNGISRDWIFFYLVLNFKKSDTEKYATRFLEILKTFQSSYEAMPSLIFYSFSVEFQNKTSFELKLIEILSWISLDDCYQLLNVFIERFEEWGWRWHSAEDVAILSHPNIRQLFWNYLGRERFLHLYEKLESHVTKSRQMEKLEVLCSIQWQSLLSGLNDDLKNLMQDVSMNMRQYRDEKYKKYQIFIEQSYDKITGWHELWDDGILSEVGQFSDTTYYLFFVCPLIELQHNKPTDIGINILCKFSKSQVALQKVAAMDEHLLDRLIQPILENLSEQNIPQKQEVQKTLELVLNKYEEMQDEYL